MLAGMLAGDVMPRRAKELTALAVEKLKADGSNRRIMVGPMDCAGLHLRLEGGTKSWALRIKVDDKRRDIGLGPYNAKTNVSDEEAAKLPGLSLAEARAKARELRMVAKRAGSILSPTAAKVETRKAKEQADLIEAAKSKTFKQCAELCIVDKRAGWKSEKHAKQWSATLEAYAYEKIGELPVGSIDRGLVLDILRPIWTEKTETASRLRGRIETVLNWAKVNGYRDGDNPAAWKGNLAHVLAERQKLARGHHAALPYAEVGDFMIALRKREGISARALELAILCASRSAEIRLAEWSEMDVEAKVWTIPAARMKAGKEHRVPLSDEAIALLAGLPRVEGSPFVFPAPRGGALSDMALTAVLKRMGHDGLTQHGFRSTFRDWAGETTAYPREVIEHALAHLLKDKAEAAYQRGTLLAKRARLMADWATYCGQASATGSNVVALQGASA
jgi:integrase